MTRAFKLFLFLIKYMSQAQEIKCLTKEQIETTMN